MGLNLRSDKSPLDVLGCTGWCFNEYKVLQRSVKTLSFRVIIYHVPPILLHRRRCTTCVCAKLN